MFDPRKPNPLKSDYSGFQKIVQKIAERSASFDGPVYLFNGDSHALHRDEPLNGTAGPNAQLSWLTFYEVTTPAPNLRRITVDGSNAPSPNFKDHTYLRVVVTSGPEVLTVTPVPFTVAP